MKSGLFIIFSFLTTTLLSQQWESLGSNDWNRPSTGTGGYQSMRVSDNGILHYIEFTYGINRIVIKRHINNLWEEVTNIDPDYYYLMGLEFDIDASDRFFIAYIKNAMLYVKMYDGNEVTDLSSNTILENYSLPEIHSLTLELDNEDNPYLSFINQEGNIEVFKYLDNEWLHLGVIETEQSAFQIKLDFYSNNSPAIAYRAELNHCNVYNFDGNTWHTISSVNSITEDFFPDFYFIDIDFCIDHFDAPIIAMSHETFGEINFYVRRLNIATNIWQPLGVPQPTYVGINESLFLALDSLNDLYISIITTSSCRVMKFQNDQWIDVAGSDQITNPCNSINIIAGINDEIFVMREGVQPSFSTIVGKFDDQGYTSLTELGILGSNLANTSIVADANENIYVVGNDGLHQGGVSVVKYSNGNWEYVGQPGFIGDVVSVDKCRIYYRQASNKLFVSVKFDTHILLYEFIDGYWELILSQTCVFGEVDFNSDDIPLITYRLTYYVDVRIGYLSNGEIIPFPTVPPHAYYFEGDHTTVSPNGDIYYSYIHSVNANSSDELRVLHLENNEWELVGSPFNDIGLNQEFPTTYHVREICSQIGTNDELTIAFVVDEIAANDSINCTLKVIRLVNGVWTEISGLEDYSTTRKGVILKLDENDNPYLVYENPDNSPYIYYNVLRHGETGWERLGQEVFHQTVDYYDASTNRVGFTISPNNSKYFCYNDAQFATWAFAYYEPIEFADMNISSSVICAGNSFDIPYEITNNAVGNTTPVFAQLSNTSGSFDNPVNLGFGIGNSGIISATIPANTLEGTGYRIRYSVNVLNIQSDDNGFDITINTGELYFQDLDGDLYGNPNVYIYFCDSVEPGYVQNNDDCDDNDPNLWQTETQDATINWTLPLVFCMNDIVVLPEGTSANGIWSGTGVTSNIFSAASAGVGTHLLQYTIPGNGPCLLDGIDTIEIMVAGCIDIVGIEAPQIIVYPTVVRDYFFIDANVNEVSIIDASGRVIRTLKLFNEEQLIQVTDLASGIYLLKITTDKVMKVVRIIKE